MPTIKPISELQRNLREIADECHETRRPVYLTKNGYASLVIMDADAFDHDMADRIARYERELATYKAVERGLSDLEAGRTHPLEEGLTLADERRKELGLDSLDL